MENKLKLRKTKSFIRVALLILILMSLVACNQNENNDKTVIDITEATENLTSSMKKYYAMDTDLHQKGEYFELKTNNFISIIPNNSDREYFNYLIYIAPRTNQELVVKSINILPSSDLKSYFDMDLSPFNGFKSQKTLMRSPYSDINYVRPSNFYALELNVTMDNYGNDNIEKSGFSKNEFDSLMKNIMVEVEYTVNDIVKKEIFNLEFEKTTTVESEADAESFPSHIQNIFQNHEIIMTYGALD